MWNRNRSSAGPAQVVTGEDRHAKAEAERRASDAREWLVWLRDALADVGVEHVGIPVDDFTPPLKARAQRAGEGRQPDPEGRLQGRARARRPGPSIGGPPDRLPDGSRHDVTRYAMTSLRSLPTPMAPRADHREAPPSSRGSYSAVATDLRPKRMRARCVSARRRRFHSRCGRRSLQNGGNSLAFTASTRRSRSPGGKEWPTSPRVTNLSSSVSASRCRDGALRRSLSSLPHDLASTQETQARPAAGNVRAEDQLFDLHLQAWRRVPKSDARRGDDDLV